MYGSEAYLRVLYSLGEGYYCEIHMLKARESAGEAESESQEASTIAKMRIDAEEIARIRTCMEELCEQNLPIVKHSMKTLDAEEMFA